MFCLVAKLSIWQGVCILIVMEHNEWLRNVTSDSTNAVARQAGLVPRTFARQVERGRIDAESVIGIAVAYGIHPVGALADTGYIDNKFAREIDPSAALSLVSEEALAREVLRRMKMGIRTDAFTTPVDELAERRRVSEVSDTMPDTAVADESPEEGGAPDDYEP